MSRKKAIVRRFSPGVLTGYLGPNSILTHASGVPSVDLLDVAGRIQSSPLSDIKYIAFVRDFNAADLQNPERLLRKTFPARPRSEGLWLRLTLRDDDILEGLAPLDESLADALMGDLGIYLAPPDIRGNTQRLYVPRAAIKSLQSVAVITTPSRKQPVPRPEPEKQPDLFDLVLPPNARPQ